MVFLVLCRLRCRTKPSKRNHTSAREAFAFQLRNSTHTPSEIHQPAGAHAQKRRDVGVEGQAYLGTLVVVKRSNDGFGDVVWADWGRTEVLHSGLALQELEQAGLDESWADDGGANARSSVVSRKVTLSARRSNPVFETTEITYFCASSTCKDSWKDRAAALLAE